MNHDTVSEISRTVFYPIDILLLVLSLRLFNFR